MSQPPSPSLPIVHFGGTDSFTQWSHAFVSAAKAIGFTWLETPRMSELVWQLFSQIGNSSPPARAKPPWRAAATPPASTEAKSITGQKTESLKTGENVMSWWLWYKIWLQSETMWNPTQKSSYQAKYGVISLWISFGLCRETTCLCKNFQSLEGL